MKQSNFEFLIPKSFFVRAAEVKLTPRETEVAELLAECKSWKEVADALGISIRTVEQHVEKIHYKVGFQRTTECVRFLLHSPGR